MSLSTLPKVEVLRMVPINNGNLKAFVTLKIGDVTIRNFRLLGEGAHMRLLEPLEYWDDGKPFYPLIVLSAELQDAALQAVLVEWRQEVCNENNEEYAWKD